MNNEHNGSNAPESDNKISIPPVFDGETNQEPIQIETTSPSTNININNSNRTDNIQGNNNIFKVPIERETPPKVENSQPSEQKPEPETNNTNNYQSSANDSTLYKDNPLPQINTGEINDQELIDAFIDKNHKRFQIPFNFFAFLFGSLYLFYRKMFLWGLLVFALEFVILNYIKITAGLLIFRLVLGFVFNKIYLGIAKKKVSKIKYIKSQESFEDLKKICASKGGTSGLQLFLGIIITLAATIIAIVLLGVSLFFNGISSVVQNANQGRVIIYDTSVNIKNEFDILVPSRFENKSEESSYKYTYNNEDGFFGKCELELLAVSNFKNPEDLINNYVNNSEITHGSNTVTVNGIEWHTGVEDLLGKVYYYATKKDGKVYLLTYTVQEDADENCDNYRSLVLNSI